MSWWSIAKSLGCDALHNKQNFKVAHISEVGPMSNDGMTRGSSKRRQCLVRGINYAWD